MNCRKTFQKLVKLEEQLRYACLNSIRFEGVSIDYFIVDETIKFNMYSLGFGGRRSLILDYNLTIENFEKLTIDKIIIDFKEKFN